jgi:hypothetical protein
MCACTQGFAVAINSALSFLEDTNDGSAHSYTVAVLSPFAVLVPPAPSSDTATSYCKRNIFAWHTCRKQALQQQHLLTTISPAFTGQSGVVAGTDGNLNVGADEDEDALLIDAESFHAKQYRQLTSAHSRQKCAWLTDFKNYAPLPVLVFDRSL